MTNTRINSRASVAPGRTDRKSNRRRVIGMLAVSTAAVALVAAPASAAPRPAEPLAGNTITCGGDVLTFTGGVQVGDLHRVPLGNGGEVVILSVVFHGATLTDEAGNDYRAVGGANSTSHVIAEGVPGDQPAHFNVNITVLGDNGRTGRVLLRERVAPDGTITTVSDGGCSL